MRAFFKNDYSKYIGLAYLSYLKAIELYDLSKLRPGKSHRWIFPAYFKQRVRYALQDERQRMAYPVRITDHAFKKGLKLTSVGYEEDLAYVEG